MCAKFKSRTHLLNTGTFFYFCRRFLRVCLQSLKKYMTLSIFFANIKKGIKNAEFHPNVKSVEKVF
jgi:hypothetical protein